MNRLSIHILLVEDSPADVLLTREALQDAEVLHTLDVVEDGMEAMDFLHKTGAYASAPRPDLILLDLNMPRKNGRDVLAEIKVDEKLMSIPVIILTTSSAEVDILKSYNLHANSYIVKPVEFEKFVGAVRAIYKFWFNIVTLPPEG